MRILKKRNLLQSIYDPENITNYFNNPFLKKMMKYSNDKENYINPIINKKIKSKEIILKENIK